MAGNLFSITIRCPYDNFQRFVSRVLGTWFKAEEPVIRHTHVPYDTSRESCMGGEFEYYMFESLEVADIFTVLGFLGEYGADAIFGAIVDLSNT